MSTAKTTLELLPHSQMTLRNAGPELVNIVLESIADWMNLNLNGNEYEYFPPYSECTADMDKMGGTYTAYIRFFDFKADSVYPDITFRSPRIHLTLTCELANGHHWVLRGELISSVYARQLIFLGEYKDCCNGDHVDCFTTSEVYTTLEKWFVIPWR